jgi:flagellar basal-body rod modification protein FlgD
MTTIQTGGTVTDDLMATMNGAKKTSSGASANSDPSSTDGADSIQNRFITLLVAQLKNQDPLNPLDNAEVTSQMAQLSTVTGISNLNTTLASLKSSYSESQTLQASSMIGRGVLAPGSNVVLNNNMAVMGVELKDPADNVQITVRNSAGETVRTFNLGSVEAGVKAVAWDGKNDSGKKVDDGTYKMDVKAVTGGKAVTATALSYGEVSSVTTGAGGIKLDVSTLGSLNMSDVRKIY